MLQTFLMAVFFITVYLFFGIVVLMHIDAVMWMSVDRMFRGSVFKTLLSCWFWPLTVVVAAATFQWRARHHRQATRRQLGEVKNLSPISLIGYRMRADHRKSRLALLFLLAISPLLTIKPAAADDITWYVKPYVDTSGNCLAAKDCVLQIMYKITPKSTGVQGAWQTGPKVTADKAAVTVPGVTPAITGVPITGTVPMAGIGDQMYSIVKSCRASDTGQNDCSKDVPFPDYIKSKLSNTPDVPVVVLISAVPKP